MSIDACVAEIEKAAGRPLTPDEMDSLGEQMHRIVRKVSGENVEDLEAAILKATDEFSDEVIAAAVIEKRNAALNYRARIKATDYINSVWADDPGTGLTAFLGGVAVARQGARDSVAASQESLASHYITGMIARLEKEGVHREFVSGTMDREIWTAMHELNQPQPDAKALSGLPKAAVAIGRILNDYNELARLDANRAGAWVKKLPGRVIKQTHDMYRVRSAGWETWRDYVMPRLDWEKTLPDVAPEAREAALKDIFVGLASGEHLSFKDGSVAGLKGIANVGKKLSHERVLHFRDAATSFDYNSKFGSGSLAEGMLYGLERMAQDTALMRRLGPNAEANLERVINDVGLRLKKAGDEKALSKFMNEARNQQRTLWPNITGASRVPANHMLAQVSSGIRAWLQMSKLGAAVLSSVADITFYGSEVRYQGGTMLGGMAEAIGGLLEGKTSTQKKEIVGMLGVLHDGMRASAATRFDVADRVPGRLAKMTQAFFKLSGLRWWTDRLRVNFALATSHRLALNAERAWTDLPGDLQRVLSLFGLEADKWDIVRRGGQAAADGRVYLTPEGIDDLADEAFSGYFQSRGIRQTEARTRELRTEIKDQLRSYFYDRSTQAVIEPDARTRAILLRGTQTGTVEGEAFRHVMLFKSFVAAVIQKPLAREIYGRGTNTTLAAALKNGNGELIGLAQLIVWNTIFGYGAMILKDLAKGRTPRDPNDVKTWMAAMTQGGGLGIYGDFLFGDMKNRFGGTPISTLAGPTAGAFEDLLDLYQRFRDGDDTAAQAFRFAVSNTPFANLFYTRAALDYLVLYNISEMMSPGYLRRMERRVEKDNAQQFLLPPSAVVPYGGG